DVDARGDVVRQRNRRLLAHAGARFVASARVDCLRDRTSALRRSSCRQPTMILFWMGGFASVMGAFSRKRTNYAPKGAEFTLKPPERSACALRAQPPHPRLQRLDALEKAQHEGQAGRIQFEVFTQPRCLAQPPHAGGREPV